MGIFDGGEPLALASGKPGSAVYYAVESGVVEQDGFLVHLVKHVLHNCLNPSKVKLFFLIMKVCNPKTGFMQPHARKWRYMQISITNVYYLRFVKKRKCPLYTAVVLLSFGQIISF